MNRGDVRRYTFHEPDKRRPVLVLTRDSAIPYLTGITIAPLTSTIRDIPTEVFLSPDDDGVLTPCAVNLDNIQTVPKRQVGSLITSLSPNRMGEVEDAMAVALGMTS